MHVVSGAGTVCHADICCHRLQAKEDEYVAKVEAALEASQVDEDRLIEERRRRRQELLARLQQQHSPQPSASGTVADASSVAAA